jgi:hypothetical protein
LLTYPASILPIKLPRAREKHSSSRHVQAHGKRFGGKEGFDETLSKENFRRLLENGKKSSMMDSDSTFQEWQNVLDLRQGPILLGQNLHRILKDLINKSLLVS